MEARKNLWKYAGPALLWGIVICIGGYTYVTEYLPARSAKFQQSAQLAALLQESKEPMVLGSRTKTADCQAQGPLPDHDCTPGAIFEDATKEEICVSGYSATVRSVSVSLKKRVFSQYGINYPVPFGSYEIDHLIPLSLGGNNTIANLWPKSAEPFPGFYEKNITGDYLREQVCDGNIALRVAQQRIADDWFSIYNNLGEETIKELKGRYKNWAERK